MTFTKSDFWRAFITGGLIALLALPVFKNLGVSDLFAGYGNFVFYLFMALWLIFLPLATGSGLYVVYFFFAKRRPVFYQVGKYGIVGLLNSFLNLGIMNFFILASGIASGLWFDFFYAVAYWGAVTNAFFWNKFWTFKATGKENIRKEYTKFFAVSGAVALINVLLMHILVNVTGPFLPVNQNVWANIASVLLVPVSFFGNFFGWKILVFKNCP